MNQQTTAPIALNPGQQDASDAIQRFLFSDEKEFAISGPAGTGKTTLMDYVMNVTLPDYEKAAKLLGEQPIPFVPVLCATTNKAAEVLQKATGLPAKTVHSHLGLKVQDNWKTGGTEIKRTKNWDVHSNELIFVDEASMIDSETQRHLHQGTDKTCKIIYLGDHCQMAPVFEDLSPVYKNPKPSALLSQPMRNAGQPALIKLCADLRLTVETLQFRQFPHVPGVIDHFDGPQAQTWIDQTFIQPHADARILAFSNARVKEYLKYIRDLRGYPDTFVTGEDVINNTGMEWGKRMLRVEEEFQIGKIGTIEDAVIDQDDPNALLEVQNLELIPAGAYESIWVRVPTSPEHHKALLRHYGKQKNWEKYFYLKNNFPDLRQRDAATVYKAQGSTYDTVFLDLENIGKCTQADQLARMLYVGASRARNRIIVFGQLPKRLFL